MPTRGDPRGPVASQGAAPEGDLPGPGSLLHRSPMERDPPFLRNERAMIILTQNIWGGAPLWWLRRRSLARRIAHLRPDVVGLQEVHAPDPGGGASQAHELGGLAGGYHAIFAPGRVTP